jgi:hypothetical protein
MLIAYRLERHGADIAVAIVGVVGEPIGRRGCLDEPRRDGVHSNPIGTVLTLVVKRVGE